MSKLGVLVECSSEKKTYRDYLDILFNFREKVCVAADVRVPLKSLEHELIKDVGSIYFEDNYGRSHYLHLEDLNYISINPIDGSRKNGNVTSYRNFLIEIDKDDMDINAQRAYIEDQLRMPFSTCVFSGNKSLHYVICLEESLKDQREYKLYHQLITSIVTLADKAVKYPSVSTRFPCSIRHSNGIRQEIVKLNGRISIDVLESWLSFHGVSKPLKKIQPLNRKVFKLISTVDINKGIVPLYVKKILEKNIVTERNNTWFKVACSLAQHGYDEFEIIDFLDCFFEEENDFKRDEWLRCINSACKRVNNE